VFRDLNSALFKLFFAMGVPEKGLDSVHAVGTVTLISRSHPKGRKLLHSLLAEAGTAVPGARIKIKMPAVANNGIIPPATKTGR